jgi:GntR family transcriptional regulator
LQGAIPVLACHTAPVPGVPKFDPHPASGHLYEQLADHLAARIMFGEIAPGTWLPSERDMAAEYAVSLDTVSKAIRLLREWRMVRTVPAKGTYVSRLDE